MAIQETQDPTGFNLEADPGYTPQVNEPVEKSREFVYFGGEQVEEPVYFDRQEEIIGQYTDDDTRDISWMYALAKAKIDQDEELEDFNSNAVAYEAAIKSGKEDNVRQSFSEIYNIELAEKAKEAAEFTLMNSGPAPSRKAIDDVEALASLKYAPGSRDWFAAEKIAAASLVDKVLSTNVHKAQELQRNLDEGRHPEVIAMEEDIRKALILNRISSRLRKVYEDESKVETILGFLAMALPFNETTGRSGNFPKGIDTSGKTLGATMEQGFTNLMNLPTGGPFEEAARQLEENIGKGSSWLPWGKNNRVVSENFDTIITMTEKKKAQVDMSALIDMGTGISTKTIAAASKSGFLGLLRLFGKGDIADAVVVRSLEKDLAKGAKLPITDEQTQRAIIPASYTTRKLLGGLEGDSSTLSKMVTESEAIRKTVDSVSTPSRITKGELEVASADVIKKETEAAKAESRFIADFDTVSTNEGHAVVFKTGKANGGGFATETEAMLFAEKRGWGTIVKGEQVVTKVSFDEAGKVVKEGKVFSKELQGRVSAFKDDTGDWFLKVEAPIDERQYMVPLDPKAAASRFPWLNWFKSSDLTSDQITQSQAAMAEFTGQAVRAAIKPLTKFMNSIGGKSRKIITDVAIKGEEKGVWYDIKEFEHEFMASANNKTRRPPTEAEILAYYTHKELHDIDYGLRNASLFTEKELAGMTGIRFTGKGLSYKGQGNVLSHASINEPANYRFYNATEDKYYGVHEITRERLKTMLTKENYKLVSMDDVIPHRVTNEPIKYVLVKDTDLKIGPLPFQQLPYRAGGHRLYKGPYFVKQAATGLFKDETKYISEPLTHIAATSKREASEWADRMEDLRVSYQKMIDGDKNIRPTDIEAKAVAAGFEGGLKDLEKAIKSGRFNLDHAFEVVYDMEMPKAHTTAINDPGYKDLSAGKFNQGIQGWYREQGRLFTSPKGEKLPGPDDAVAAVLDPWETSQRAIANSINNKAWLSFRVSQAERWAKTWENMLDKTGFDPGDRASLFWHGTFKRTKAGGDDEQLVAAAEAQRNTIMRLMGAETKASVKLEHSIRSLAEWVDAKGWKSTGQFLLDIRSKDPVTFMRSWAFDLKLGMLNPSQLIMQAQTMFATVALNPIDGFKAFASAPAVRAALINGSDEVLGFMANRTALHGMDPKEFKLMASQLRKSGIMNVGNEMAALDAKGTHIMGSVTNAVDKTREFGRVFLYEGERLNRITAYSLAWREFRKLNPKDDITSVFAQEWLTKKTNDYSMRMIRTSNAAWQKGFASLGTQFLAYQARMIENILPEFLGGYKGFTGRQKAGLFISQALLYGTAGIPFMDFAASTVPGYKDMDPEMQRWVTSGLVDGVIRAASSGEVDTDFAQRAGLGKGIENWLNDIAMKSDKSILEIIGGPSLAIMGEFAGSSKKVMDFIWANDNPSGVQQILLEDFTQYVSTLKYLDKARMVAKYNAWYNNQGKYIAGVTDPEAYYVALGIPMKKVTNYYRGIQEVSDTEKTISETAKSIHKLILEARQNPERMDILQNRISGLLTHEDPPVRMKIMQKVYTLGGGINNAYGDMMMKRHTLGLDTKSFTLKPTTDDKR